jgi:PadR family transcriptional regulator, regulatory protein AphA
MSLRYAILGLLSVEPMTGYDLLDYFDPTAGLVWQASQAQVYLELRDMERDGLLAARIAARGARGQKRLYAITRRGSADLRRWAKEPAAYPPERDPALLKASYLDEAPYAEARAMYEAHIGHYTERMHAAQKQLDGVRERSASLIQRRLASRDESDHEAIVKYKAHVLGGLVARSKMEIAWARRGLAIVTELEHGAAPAAQRPTKRQA